VGTPVELPSAYQTTLLRAAQASLANVWAHAHARAAVVTLSFPGTEVMLDVFDDGVGFEPSTAAGTARGDGTGVGLMSLRERLAALDGNLEIESAPGEGTVVAIRVPLPADEGAS
jgi:signal transduction histidine kinase